MVTSVRAFSPPTGVAIIEDVGDGSQAETFAPPHPVPHRRSFVVAAENYQTVARVGELQEGVGQVFEVDGRLIALFLEEGNYYAIDDGLPQFARSTPSVKVAGD